MNYLRFALDSWKRLTPWFISNIYTMAFSFLFTFGLLLVTWVLNHLEQLSFDDWPCALGFFSWTLWAITGKVNNMVAAAVEETEFSEVLETGP